MTKYSSRYASSPEAVKKYDTQQLREEFLIDNLMQEDEIVLTYSHYDRYIAGSAVPVKDLILEMHESGKSIRDITQKINYRLARTNLGVSLSTFTIHQVIKKGKNEI